MKLGDFQQLDENASTAVEATPESEHSAIEGERSQFAQDMLDAAKEHGSAQAENADDSENVTEPESETDSEPEESQTTDVGEDVEETEETPADEVDAGDTPDAAQTSEEPKYDPALLSRAANLNWGPGDVLQHQDDASLEAAVAEAEKAQGQQTQQTQQTDAPPEIKPYELQLDPEEYDDQLRTQLEAMNEHYAKQLQNFHERDIARDRQMQDVLQQQLEQQQLVANQAAIEKLNTFDKWIESKGETYKGLLGEGESQAMWDDPTRRMTPECFNREKVYKLADKMQDMFPDDSPEELYDRALASVSADQAKTIARKELQAETQKRRKSAVPRPTSRKKPAPKASGKDAADQAAAKWDERMERLNSGRSLIEDGTFAV